MRFLEPTIETWDSLMHRHYHVVLPMRFLVITDRIGMTWLMIRLIWGIGTKKKLAPSEE